MICFGVVLLEAGAARRVVPTGTVRSKNMTSDPAPTPVGEAPLYAWVSNGSSVSTAARVKARWALLMCSDNGRSCWS